MRGRCGNNGIKKARITRQRYAGVMVSHRQVAES